MALKALAVAVTLIAGLGLAATAEARCGGRAFSDASNAAPHRVVAGGQRPSSGLPDSAAWMPATASSEVTLGVTSDPDAVAEYRRMLGRDRIPVDENGMPRRRC